MISMKSLASTLAFAALAAAHGAVPARADGYKDVQVAPLKVINMDVGTKHAIGYYLAENGACSLTVLLTDFSYDGDAVPSASRVSVNVAGGTSAKVDTIDGTTMAFACAAGASNMTVRTFSRVAQSPYLAPSKAITK